MGRRNGTTMGVRMALWVIAWVSLLGGPTGSGPVLAEGAVAPYPRSTRILDVEFDSVVELAPGSDNWAITWAADGHQYTTWGDGGGFGGDNDDGRVSLGVGRVEGPAGAYAGFNVWGGKNPENPAQFTGKSYGILALGNTLYLWRTGDGSGASSFEFQELYESTDSGATWRATAVRFDDDSFPFSRGFFAPTFLQFGRGYGGGRDGFVYSYAPENRDGQWDVQIPGEIALIRAPATAIADPAAYDFFAGLDAAGEPLWTSEVSGRQPVFEDPVNGVMRTSVSYNAGLERYFLLTQQVARERADDGHLGLYEAPEPWGPWRTVLFENAWDRGVQTGSKTVYWNFSNKWLSVGGRDFVLVYTGPGSDNWGTLEGSFVTVECTFPDEVEMTGRTIADAELVAACRTILVGDDVSVQPGATLTLVSGGEVVFRDDFSVLEGGSLEVFLDRWVGTDGDPVSSRREHGYETIATDASTTPRRRRAASFPVAP